MKDLVRFFTIMLLHVAIVSSAVVTSNAQCEVFSDNGYSVQISLLPTIVIPDRSPCPDGYNWNVEIDYNIQLVGASAPDNLWTLQGFLYCEGNSTFFQLPNDGGMGTTTTVGNIWRPEMDCDEVTLDSLNCDSIVLRVQGPGVDTSINCPLNPVPCPDGAELTRNNFCIFLSWDSIVPPLADSLVFADEIYYYEEGSGTGDDPAVYKSGGGNGACNAQRDSLKGDLIIRSDTCIFTDAVLPVSFVSFEASKIGPAQARLYWTVSAEDGVESYVIQYHPDHGDWEDRSIVSPSISLEDGQKTYEFVDRMDGKAVRHYYRISAIDIDGSSSFSSIAMLEQREHTSELVLAPNPLKVGSPLTIHGLSGEDYRVSVTSVMGAQWSKAVHTQDQRMDLDLIPGTYILRFTHKQTGRTYTSKLCVY